MQIEIWNHDPDWPIQFEIIKAELTGDLTDSGIPFLSIEHIGSTAIPHLPAKPIIDILIIIPLSDFNPTRLQEFRDALGWGNRQGGYHYIGNGGVQGRWSFKLAGKEPQRNVYVVAERSLPVRSCLSLRDTLHKNVGLRDEYGRLKIELAERDYDNVMQYSTLKNPVVRKILLEAGWSEEEIDEKEANGLKDWPRELETLEIEPVEESWWDRVNSYFSAVDRIWSRFWTLSTSWWRCFRWRRLESDPDEGHWKECSETGW